MRRPPPSRLWRLHLAAALVGLVAGAALIAPTLMRERAAAVAEAAAWTIPGPPCRRVAPAGEAREPTPIKGFGYAGSAFAYAYGHVACAQIHANEGRSAWRGYPVCQFTSPGVVAVDTGKTRVFFSPGLGRRATISVEDATTPRCVLGGRFYGQQSF